MKEKILGKKSGKNAVILIEFQKTWTEKGIFHNLIKSEYHDRNVLSSTLSLLEAARANGLDVIHAPLIIDKKDKAQYKKLPFLPKFLRRFTRGTWKAEFTEGVHQTEDIVITGRTAFDATVDSNLEDVITQGNYDNLFFCGFTTDHCVSETMETLIKKRHNCILVSDCTATRNAKIQKKMEEKFPSISSSEIITKLASSE